jgi:hypothetical protein
MGGNNDVITELFLPRGSLFSDIPAGDGKLVNLFYGVALSSFFCHAIDSPFWVRHKSAHSMNRHAAQTCTLKFRVLQQGKWENIALVSLYVYLDAVVGSGEEPGESSGGADDCAEPRRILACWYFVLSANGGDTAFKDFYNWKNRRQILLYSKTNK